MAEWIKYLNAGELADLIALDKRIWEHQGNRRKLMNRAKQRRLRERRENNLPPR